MAVAAEAIAPGQPLWIDTLECAHSHGPVSGLSFAGVVLEALDLGQVCAFYDAVFPASGTWRRDGERVEYQFGRQRVEFAQRSRSRSSSPAGQHQAYRVGAQRLPPLVDELRSKGHEVHCWREDHPEERTPAPYVEDPSGNRMQLLDREPDGGLLDHAAIELHDLELAEVFYVNCLGGSVDYCHGWAMEDYVEAKAWGAGTDPCAPWTRRFDVRYWDKVRLPRPNMQLFVRFGDTRLGLMLATTHRQEPSPHALLGTPRIILESSQPLGTVADHLAKLRIPAQLANSSLFLRDPGGNYVQIDSAR